MKSARLPVMELMTKSPVTAPPDLPVHEAAALMRDREVGSVIVTDEHGAAIGIVTERDFVTKVVARGGDPSSLRVRDVMTSPVIFVHPHEDVEAVARKMSKRRVRRMPVVKDGKLVGVITENDILRMLPNLVEVTREWARTGLDAVADFATGHCDACGVLSNELTRDGKLLLCPDCKPH